MRKWARLLTAGILVGVVGLYPLLAPRPHRIDQAHFDRISKGMTRDQVVALFGVPPGEYDWAEQDGILDHLVVLEEAIMIQAAKELLAITTNANDVREVIQVGPDNSVIRVWTSRHGYFIVSFDAEYRVVATAMSPEVRVVPPWQRWWRNWKK